MAVKRTKELVYDWIEYELPKAGRDLRRGVLPRDMQPRLPFYRAEGSLRRDMSAMWGQGRLVRVDGAGARQGYRLPTLMERVAFSINGGVWPVGVERVAVI